MIQMFTMTSLPDSIPTIKIAATFRRVMPVAAIAFLIGCVQIPPEAIELNKKISENITVLKEDILQYIDAWEIIGHTQIDENWNVIYTNATEIYNSKSAEERKKLGIDPALKNQDIGKLATAIIQKAKANISDKAKEMRRTIEKNTQTVIVANDAISRLLTSANDVAKTRTYVLGDLEKYSPIEIPDLNEAINKAMSKEVN